MPVTVRQTQPGERPGRLRCPTDAEWAEIVASLPPGSFIQACEHTAIDRNGVVLLTPPGHWWFPISDSEHAALPQAGVAGVPLGDLLGVLETGGVGRKFVDQLPELVRSGQLEQVVKAQVAARSKGGFFDDFLSVALPFIASVGGNLIGPGLGTILGPVTSAALSLGGMQGSSTAQAITPLLTSVGASVSTPGTPLNQLATNLLTSLGLAAPAPPPIPASVGLPPAPAPALPAAAPSGLGAVLQSIFGPGVSGDLGGIATLGAQLLQLAGTFAPDIVKALQGWDKTHSKHIPQGLAGLLLLMGRFAQRPTARDKGLILNIADLKQGLSSLGVRFSPDEELDDVVTMEPLGNVIASGFEAAAERTQAIIEQIGSAAAVIPTAVGDAVARVAVPLTEALTKGGKVIDDALADKEGTGKGLAERLIAGLSGAITKGILPDAQAVVAFAGPVVESILGLAANLIIKAVHVIHEPVGNAMMDPFARELQKMTDAIAGEGRIGPDGVFEVAKRTFNKALEVGIFAHALSGLVEWAHPTHHMGFSFLAAGLTDAAAFGPIAAATVGTQIRAAIGRPMQWRANVETRSNLPDLRAALDAYVRGFIPWETMEGRLMFEGWPDGWIAAFKDVPFRRPSARELAAIFEDVDVDDAWVLRMLREQGYRPEDADRALAGVRLRSNKGLRQGLLLEAQSAYEEGWFSVQDLQGVIDGLGVRPENHRLIHQRASIARLRHNGKIALAAYRTQAEAQAMDATEYHAALGNLGIDPEVVAAEIAAVDGRVKARTHREERSEVKAEVRHIQGTLTQVLQEQVRRGLVSPEGMAAQLQQAGVHELPAHLAGVLAGLRALPAPRLPTVLSVQAAEEKVRELQAHQVDVLVRKGLVPPTAGTLALMHIGIPQAEAQARTELAVAHGLEPPKMQEPPKEAPAVREARRIRTQEALAAYRAGEIPEGVLRAHLVAAGQPGDVVDALVSRAVTEATIAAERDAARVAGQVRAAALKAAARAA